jgi:hypothetical protein
MNDDRTGMLATARWKIPAYAREMLWLDTESDAVQVEGERGLFQLDAPAEWLTLRWGHEKGPALARLRWRPDCLEWDGTVRLGGYVDSLHLTALPGIDEAIGVLHLGGQPLLPDTHFYTPAVQRTTASYEMPDFYGGLADDVPETYTSWLVGEDSPLLTMAQDAMLNKMRVWFSGRLGGFDQHFALPLVLEAITLFAP